MTTDRMVGTDADTLMALLANNDGVIRNTARESLTKLGEPAALALSRALRESASEQVRWEAAKALGAMGEPASIPTLVKALEDDNTDVAWLAAEALRTFGKGAWKALLGELVRRGPDSVLLRQGTHHVLAHQKEDGFDEALATLMSALEMGGVPGTESVAAGEVLKLLRDNG